MKTQFMNFLHIVAGILLATSCGKDDDSTVTANNEPSNNEPTPVEIVAQPEYVKIPFSVKVDNGSKLSKMSYTGSDASITRSFEDSEADKLTMIVTGNGIKESTLTLKKTAMLSYLTVKSLLSLAKRMISQMALNSLVNSAKS